MNDQQFYKNVATICVLLLEVAKHTSLDVGLLVDTMLELDKRAKKAGLKYSDLYPKNK